MKKISKLITLASVSLCLISAAQAEETQIQDVVFSPATFTFEDIPCGINRSVVYTLNNYQGNAITLNGIEVQNVPGDTSGITITPVKAGCVTALDAKKIGSGSIPGTPVGSPVPGTCNLTLAVTAPACSGGPVQAPIARQLFIGVVSQQGSLIGNINAKVSVIGSGESFAMLSATAVNNSQGTSQVSGNLATKTGGILPGFSVKNGAFYATKDTLAANAEIDFGSAYKTLLVQLTPPNLGCNPRTSMNGGEVIYSGSYCLYPPASQSTKSYFSVGNVGGSTQTITLSGSENFYFYVDSLNDRTTPASAVTGCKTPAGANYRCDLMIQSNTSFNYVDGASPENVYWIMGNSTNVTANPSTYLAGQVLLGANTKLDGTVLHGSAKLPTPAIVSISSSSPTLVTGRLWANSKATTHPGAISLYGNTVALPSTFSMLEGFEEGESVWY